MPDKTETMESSVVDPRRQWTVSLKTILLRLRQTGRLMVGVPDYQTYVAHRQASHPGEPVMSYKEFFRERQNSRYGCADGKISRCC